MVSTSLESLNDRIEVRFVHAASIQNMIDMLTNSFIMDLKRKTFSFCLYSGMECAYKMNRFISKHW